MVLGDVEKHDYKILKKLGTHKHFENGFNKLINGDKYRTVKTNRPIVVSNRMASGN